MEKGKQIKKKVKIDKPIKPIKEGKPKELSSKLSPYEIIDKHIKEVRARQNKEPNMAQVYAGTLEILNKIKEEI
jgi:hypothetical protein